MPVRVPGRLFLRNLVEKRGLLAQLVRRDFEQRFVGSAVGWIWGLIHPLVQLASWTFLFQVCLDTRLPAGEVTQNYPLFLFAGMLPATPSLRRRGQTVEQLQFRDGDPD